MSSHSLKEALEMLGHYQPENLHVRSNQGLQKASRLRLTFARNPYWLILCSRRASCPNLCKPYGDVKHFHPSLMKGIISHKMSIKDDVFPYQLMDEDCHCFCQDQENQALPAAMSPTNEDKAAQKVVYLFLKQAGPPYTTNELLQHPILIFSVCPISNATNSCNLMPYVHPCCALC